VRKDRSWYWSERTLSNVSSGRPLNVGHRQGSDDADDDKIFFLVVLLCVLAKVVTTSTMMGSVILPSVPPLVLMFSFRHDRSVNRPLAVSEDTRGA